MKAESLKGITTTIARKLVISGQVIIDEMLVRVILVVVYFELDLVR